MNSNLLTLSSLVILVLLLFFGDGALGFVFNSSGLVYVFGQSSGSGVMNGSGLYGLNSPSTVSVNNGIVWVADSLNSRIVGYRLNGSVIGAAATYVFQPGQPIFYPYGILFDTDSTLYTSNWVDNPNPVIFKSLPPYYNTSTASPANIFSSPEGMLIDQNTNSFYVCDSSNSRILRYSTSSLPTLSLATPNFVIGQADTSSKFSNRQGSPGPNTLFLPQYITSDCRSGFFVSDSYNNRVLHFAYNATAADIVFGQPDFVTNTTGTSQTKFYRPLGLVTNSDCTSLYVADFGNNRIVRFTSSVGSNWTNNQAAESVYGQPDFTTWQAFNPTNISGVTGPGGLYFDGTTGYLWIADFFNNRVVGGLVEYIAPSPSISLSRTSSTTSSRSFSISASATISATNSVSTSRTAASASNSVSTSRTAASASNSVSTSLIAVSVSNSVSPSRRASATSTQPTTNSPSTLPSISFSHTPNPSYSPQPALVTSCGDVQITNLTIQQCYNSTIQAYPFEVFVFSNTSFDQIIVAGDFILSNSSLVLVSPPQVIAVQNCANFAGILHIILSPNSTHNQTQDQNSNITVFTYDCYEGEFQDIFVFDNGYNDGAGCKTHGTGSYGPKSMAVVLGSKCPGLDSSGGENTFPLYILLPVVIVAVLAVLVIITLLIVIISIIACMIWKRNRTKSIGKITF